MFQETGRFGRITKNLRKLGFENEMDKILFDSLEFNKLNKNDQTKYIETIVERMDKIIGSENTKRVLFECGSQCCGKSWSKFAKNVWEQSKSLDDFFVRINKAEEKYNTYFVYDSKKNIITLTRTKCICGLINKGEHFSKNKPFCNCSLGHMSVFFNSIFNVVDIKLKKSIYSGDKICEWLITIESLSNKYRTK